MNAPTLTFCGAAGEVSGSCYYLKSNHSAIVIDCGAFQGSRYADTRNTLPFPFDPKTVDAVILTHAHFDHVGRLPKLLKDGYQGPIFATLATAELAEITLLDSAHLLEEEAKRHGEEPLFTQKDVEELRNRWRTITYHQQSTVAPGITVTPVNAGHILGSASLAIETAGCRIAFSGDLGNSQAPLLRSTEFLHGANYAVIESTYGTRTHEPAADREKILITALEISRNSRGALLIPAFAVERSQELLFLLRNCMEKHPELRQPVYLDSPLATAATKVFERHHELLHLNGQKGDIFSFAQLNISQTPEESKQINQVVGPHVILAGSGMMNGGRILHHLEHNLGLSTSQLLILGYQADGTLGQRLQSGEEWVKVYSTNIQVKAQISSHGAFSGHADRPALLRWVEEVRSPILQHVFVVHGELETAKAFATELNDSESILASVPSFGQTVEIGA